MTSHLPSHRTGRRAATLAFAASLTWSLSSAFTATAAVPPTPAPSDQSTAVALDEATVAEIERLLGDSLTAIPWDCCGADGTPTGASVAIRVPGGADTLLAVGNEVDGSPFRPTAPFLAGGVAIGLVQSVAWQLIDAGVLDPDATVDAWAPLMPDAAKVTVRMLADGNSGWGGFGALVEANVVPDLARIWELEQVVDVGAAAPAVGPPGTATNSDVGATVLASIMEKVTGSTLTDLIAQYVSEPLGLIDTTIDVTAPHQPDFQDGVFVLGGQRLDTNSVPTDAYFSFTAAGGGATSSMPDLLVLLDAWVTGSLVGPDRAATAERFLPQQAAPNSTTTIFGVGTPVHGYCDPRTGAEQKYPCTPDGGGVGVDVMAIGRRPNVVGTTLLLWHFPDTGISVVVHHNSQEWVDRQPLDVLAIEIHDLVAASL